MAKNIQIVLNQEEVNSGLKSQLVYRPLADTLTFGLYSYISSSDATTTSS